MGAVVAVIAPVITAVIVPAAIYFGAKFFMENRCRNALMSSREVMWPPISGLLREVNKVHLVGTMNDAFKTGNANAIRFVGEQLSAVHLDYINNAFVQAAKSKSICYRCKKKVQFIDDLCYCEISDTQCHHGTTCCSRRKIHAVTYS